MSSEYYIPSGLVEQYVLGLCNAEEELQMAELRAKYPEVNQAILDFEAELEAQFTQAAQPVASDVSSIELQQLLQKIEPEPATLAPIVNMQTKPGNKRRYLFAAAAACVLLLLSIAGNVQQYLANKKQLADITVLKNIAAQKTKNDIAILTNPKLTPIAMYGVGYHSICRCTMWWDKENKKIYVMIHHLPQTGNKTDYYLWANVDGKMVNMGVINDGIRDRFIEMPGAPEGAGSFMVTLENAGQVTVPGNDVYLQGKI
jgi:hypothetical protein